MNKIVKKLFDGMIMGVGFSLFCLVIAAVVFFFFIDFNTKASIVSKLQEKGLVEEVVQGPDKSASIVKRVYLSPPLPTPAGYKEVWVSNDSEFLQAMKQANGTGYTAIVLEDGIYNINNTIYITAEHIMVKSATGNPYDVVLKGTGMAKGGRVKGIFRVNANYFTLDGVTLTDVPNHLVQVAGEINASYPHFRHVIFQDAYEQLLKVSYNYKTLKSQENKSIGGIVDGCIFQYTQGIGPNFYIGGVDALGAENWVVKNSIFRDIASPSDRIAQYAVHFWDNADNNIVTDNIFIDNDRAIGFGMRLPNRGIRYAHKGGVAKNNVIYHTNNGDPFADVGIMAEGNIGLTVADNIIFQMHPYENAIEYRWDNSDGINISGNMVNKRIQARDGAVATLNSNMEMLTLEQFLIEFQKKSDLLNVSDYKHPVEGRQ
tara:strand:+ start:1049 stop:2338 length:1290 start_codon:yes stop_codon:yes gene_type:complete